MISHDSLTFPIVVFVTLRGDYVDIKDQYGSLALALGVLRLAYVHMVDHSSMGEPKPESSTVNLICDNFRRAGGQSIILSGGYDRDRAEDNLARGTADLIAFGRHFIANPDLVARMKNRAPLADADQSTFYSPGPIGYTDYPLLIDSMALKQ